MRCIVVLALTAATLAGIGRDNPADAAPTCEPASNVATSAEPWPQQQLDYARAWAAGRGAGVTIAVLDSGVSATAPALAGRVLPGVDVLTGGRADSDCLGHGTFVAALAAARPVAGSAFVGVAPDARILPVRVVGSDGQLDVSAATLARGIDAALAGGATVIATAATVPSSSADLAAAIRRARDRGVVVVAPAVTDSPQPGDVAEPAALPGVVAVQGVDRFGRPVDSGPPQAPPTLCAPAAELVGVPPSGRGTIAGSGSALAVGFVAGAAALVQGRFPELGPDAVRSRLAVTAIPLAATPSTALAGAGLLDPVAAVGDIARLPAEHAPLAGRRAAVVLPRRAHASDRSAQAATRWTLAVLGGGALTALLTGIARAGRRRRGRPLRRRRTALPLSTP